MPGDVARTLARPLLLLLLAGAALVAADAGFDRHRFMRHCISKYAPADLGLPQAPAAAHADFCRQAEAAGGAEATALLGAVRALQASPPSPAQVEAAMLAGENAVAGGAASDEQDDDLPEEDRHGAGGQALALLEAGAALAYETKSKWPTSTVPYCVKKSLDATGEALLTYAVTHLEAHTCLRFVLLGACRTAKPRGQYISAGGRAKDQCFSNGIGVPRRRRHINIGPRCGGGAAPHELLHAVGFVHEHNRPDRDLYVQLNKESIKASWKAQYWKAKKAPGLGKYDFDSIMHYSNGAGSAIMKKNPKNPAAMQEVAAGKRQTGANAPAGSPWAGGRNTHLSALDVVGINQVYCPGGTGSGTGLDDRTGSTTGVLPAPSIGGGASRPNPGGDLKGAALEAWFEALAKGAAGGAAKVTHAGTKHTVECGGAKTVFERLASSEGQVNQGYVHGVEKHHHDALWRWTGEGKTLWQNVPGMIADDGTSPPACALHVIEALAKGQGRTHAADALDRVAANKHVAGVKSAQKEANGAYKVTCASAPNDCQAVAYYRLNADGFWGWSPNSGSGKDGYVPVASWDGKACPCHNSLNAALSTLLGGDTRPSGHYLRQVSERKCLYRKSERTLTPPVLWVPAKGSCRKAGKKFSVRGCRADGDCGTDPSEGCRGTCVCGRRCKCLRPLDPNTESCKRTGRA